MNTQEALDSAQSILNGLAYSSSRPEENRLDAILPPQNLKPAVEALLVKPGWGYLSAITGLDHPDYEVDPATNLRKPLADQGSVEVLYHFCNGAAVTTLRVMLPYSDPTLDSICDIVSSATLYERELMELFGVELTGTPNKEHLILPDDWPEGVYPLRKSFSGFTKSSESEKG